MAMIVLLILLLFVSMIILALSSRHPYAVHTPGRVAIALVAPFQKAIIQVSGFFQDIWENYFFLTSVVDDNKHLREQLAHYRALTRHQEEVGQENNRLRRMLGMSRTMDSVLVSAQVVGKDPSPWFQTLLVDKGSDDGVSTGLPVVNPDGIVGMVIEVTGHFSKVMLLTDPNSAVDAVVQKSRARGIIKGGSAGFCMLHFALSKYPVEVGDTVVSSGLDGVFPKGQPIGEVIDVVTPPAALFHEVTIRPYVDFERLEEVSIVLDNDLDQPI